MTAAAEQLSWLARIERIASVRIGVPDDLRFVGSSWRRSYRADLKQRGDELGYIHEDVYGDGHRELIERALERSHLGIICSTEDPHLIYSWTVIEDGVLHYAFTRLDMRGRGFCRALCEVFSHQGQVTHWTAATKRWKARGEATYNPYPFWRSN